MNLQERATLAALADVLIPAGADLPSASEAGVAEKWLDEVLTALPEVQERLAGLLGALWGRFRALSRGGLFRKRPEIGPAKLLHRLQAVVRLWGSGFLDGQIKDVCPLEEKGGIPAQFHRGPDLPQVLARTLQHLVGVESLGQQEEV